VTDYSPRLTDPGLDQELFALPPYLQPLGKAALRSFLFCERKTFYPHARSLEYCGVLGTLWAEVLYTVAEAREYLRDIFREPLTWLGYPPYPPLPPPWEPPWYSWYAAWPLVYHNQCPTLSESCSGCSALDWDAFWGWWENDLSELSEDASEQELERVMTNFIELLTPELEALREELDSTLAEWRGFAQPMLEEIYELLSQLHAVLYPEQSDFISENPETGFPGFVFRDPNDPLNPRQIVPTPARADVITNGEPIAIACRPNLYDLIAQGFQTVLAYLGAQTFPRGWYPPDADTTELPQWQIQNLSDAVAQVHQELRDTSFVRAEIRTGPQEEDKEEVVSSLPEAVGALLGAVSEISLDAQRAHLLSAQAARTALTVSAQIGTKTFPGTIDLGWRGKAFAPSTDSASLLQVLAAIETQLNAISVALGIAPKPPEQE